MKFEVPTNKVLYITQANLKNQDLLVNDIVVLHGNQNNGGAGAKDSHGISNPLICSAGMTIETEGMAMGYLLDADEAIEPKVMSVSNTDPYTVPINKYFILTGIGYFSGAGTEVIVDGGILTSGLMNHSFTNYGTMWNNILILTEGLVVETTAYPATVTGYEIPTSFLQ